MPIPIYLAMTASELVSCSKPPQYTAWMAGHLWAESAQPAAIPPNLPPASLLVMDDRESYNDYNAAQIANKLADLFIQAQCSAILLDFQRYNMPQQQSLVAEIEKRDLPFAVSAGYASGRSCTVFAPPLPFTTTLDAYLKQWQGRKVWLELALDATVITVTPEGSVQKYLPVFQPCCPGQNDRKLHCHYSIQFSEDTAVFTLWRTKEDIEAIAKQAEHLGVSLSVGLWHELQ